jgi:hypothetical protein
MSIRDVIRSAMSTFDPELYEDLYDHFGHDDSDDTYGLTTWFESHEAEEIVQFCMMHNICPVELAYRGINAIMHATISSDALAVVLRIPPCN